jgi:predicted dehydrogenase
MRSWNLLYKVGVIGLGHIAATYATPDTEHPYCHVGGIRLSDKVVLTAAADLSEAARVKFKEIWGGVFPDVNVYATAKELLSSEQLDIVAICVKGPYHYSVMMEVLEAGPKVVFLEKPPTCSLAEMDDIIALAKKKQITITVSYSRHWTPQVLHMQQLVEGGLIGTVNTIVGYSGGPILSYASHTTDLICQFAGYYPHSIFARGKISGEAPDGFEVEPQLDAMTIQFANGITGIQVGFGGEHGEFYCEVFGTKGRIRTGMYVKPSAVNEEGEPIDLSGLNFPNDASVFTIAYDQIADYLSGGPLPNCTDEHFITVNEIGFAAIESILTNNTVMIPNTNRQRKVYANS